LITAAMEEVITVPKNEVDPKVRTDLMAV
jgi:hypothetical protein